MSLLRAAAVGCLVALASLGLAGSEQKTITVWGIAFGPDTKGFEALVREFERRNPDLKVRVLSMGAGKMNPQKLMTAIVGDVAPDVVKQDRFSIGEWASRNAFLSLSPLIERDRVSDPFCPTPEQYDPGPWSEAMYQGQVYAIPESADNRILYYNKGIFRQNANALREAGLDPERAPRTWSELLKYSKVLTQTNKDGSLKRAGYLPNFGNTWLYLYAFQNNADFLTPDGRNCTMATPEAAEALQFIVNGYDIVGGYEKAEAFRTGFQSGENDPFILGRVAMKTDGDWILKDLAIHATKLDFGVAPAPVPDDRYHKRGRFANEPNQFITWQGGFSYAIPRGAKNPEEGWRFVKFASSVEGRMVEARANRDWEARRGRAYVPRVTASRVTNEQLFEELRPKDKRFAEALAMHFKMAPFGRVRPVSIVGQRLWDEHVRAMERACLKAKTPMDSLKESQAVIQKELDVFYSAEKFPIVDSSIAIWASLAAAAGLLTYVGILFRNQRLGKLGRNEAAWGYLLIMPWFVGFLVFRLGPMVSSLFYSFTQYNVLSPARWVGFNNYADMFGFDGPNIQKAFANAAYLAGVGVPIGIITGLAVAMLLNAAVGGIRAYRAIYYMPAIVPTTASAILWSWMLNPNPSRGIINTFWQSTIQQWLAIPPPGWLTAEAWAKPALIVMGVWGAGSGMILWLAALKGVSRTLYEAAEIDGAVGWRQFWSVTVPQLSPIIFFNLVMGFIGALQEFDRIYIMKPAEGSAGPNDSLLMPSYHLFQNGFAYFKMGYASAIAWTMFLIVLALTWLQFRLKNRWVYEEVNR